MREIPFPQINPTAQTWGGITSSITHRSPLSLASQTRERPGFLLSCVVEWQTLSRQEADRLRAFWMSMLGSATYTRVFAFSKERPSGALHGAPRVAGANQTGFVLSIDGCPIGSTLRTGDIVEIDGKWYVAASDCTAGIDGVMTIPLCRPIMKSPADNALVNWDRPAVPMHLTSAVPQFSDRSGGLVASLSLDFLEISP